MKHAWRDSLFILRSEAREGDSNEVDNMDDGPSTHNYSMDSFYTQLLDEDFPVMTRNAANTCHWETGEKSNQWGARSDLVASIEDRHGDRYFALPSAT
jgi:hypothetical protein